MVSLIFSSLAPNRSRIITYAFSPTFIHRLSSSNNSRWLRPYRNCCRNHSRCSFHSFRLVQWNEWRDWAKSQQRIHSHACCQQFQTVVRWESHSENSIQRVVRIIAGDQLELTLSIISCHFECPPFHMYRVQPSWWFSIFTPYRINSISRTLSSFDSVRVSICCLIVSTHCPIVIMWISHFRMMAQRSDLAIVSRNIRISSFVIRCAMAIKESSRWRRGMSKESIGQKKRDRHTYLGGKVERYIISNIVHWVLLFQFVC